MDVNETAGTIEQVVWIKVEEDNDQDTTDESMRDEEKATKKHSHSHQYNNYLSSPPTSYSCNVCIKSFTNKYALTRHLRTHVDAGKYKCLTCEKCFNDKSNLIQHERIHTGEKRYICEQCQMRFTHKATLNSHLLTHTGLKAFKCTHCGMFFARGHTMRKHINRKHSGNKKRMKKRINK